MAVQKQNLLTILVVLIVAGAILWLVPWPAEAQAATDIVGQVLFWAGIALLILWICIVAYHEAKSP